MGYMKHKYTRAYFLKEDVTGNKTVFGAEGIDEFKRGCIREQDLDILRRIDFHGKNILDLGFGRGEAIKYALDNGACKCVGVDFSEDATIIAREFLTRYGLHADLYCLDALSFFRWYELQKESQKFDIVLMLDFVEHIPRSELTEVLMLMHSWLTNQAVLAINTPVFQIDNDVVADGLNPKARDTSDDYDETVGMHCNRYTKMSLRKYMDNCGFTSISGHFFVPNFTVARVLEGTQWAWWKASKHAYPILCSTIWQRERFEYAISWDQIRKKQNSMKYKIYRTIKSKFKSRLKRMSSITKRASLAFSRLFLGRYHCDDSSKLNKKTEPQWLVVTGGPLQGHYMLLDLKAPAFWQKEMMEGHYDSFIYDALSKRVPINGATVWDIGAHIGYHSLAFAALAGPYGSVVAFEPNPYNIDRFHQNLERNVDLRERITLMSCALGNIDGEDGFFFSPEIDDGRSSGSHLSRAFVPEEPLAYQSFSQTKVSVVTADTLLREGRVPAPSIIKIDVEGAEALVLAGAHKLINNIRPILLIEVHHIRAMHDTLNTLLRMGYQTSILEDAPNSSSRCFIIAQPENGGSFNSIMLTRENTQ